jgi:predicted nucleotidyltransferase
MTDQPTTGLGIADIIGDKREAILKLAARYGATNVRVFGSVARPSPSRQRRGLDRHVSTGPQHL